MNEVAKVDNGFDQLYTLLAATDKAHPDKAAIVKLRQHLVKYPDLANVAGDLAFNAKIQIIGNALVGKKGTSISIETFYEQLRDNLGYKTSSAMERMLIEHICLCWLRLHVTEIRYEMNMKSDMVISQCRYWEDKLSIHQNRYLRSIEALARVLRLLKEPRSAAVNVLLAQQFNRV